MTQINQDNTTKLQELSNASLIPDQARQYVSQKSEFFLKLTDTEVKNFYPLLWRQYVQLAYRHVQSVPKELAALFFAKTAVTAFLLGIDVEDRFFEYIDQNSVDEQAVQQLYADIKMHMQDADMLCGSEGVLSFTDFYTASNRPNIQSDTVARSEWFVTLGQSLFSKEMLHEDIDIDRTDVATRLVSWVTFFFENIDIVWARERYRTGALEALLALENRPVAEVMKLTFENVSERFGRTVQIGELQQHIVNSFGEPHAWTAQMIPEIIEVVSNKASELDDPQINSLVIYNESTGTFEWNETLLTS